MFGCECANQRHSCFAGSSKVFNHEWKYVVVGVSPLFTSGSFVGCMSISLRSGQHCVVIAGQGTCDGNINRYAVAVEHQDKIDAVIFVVWGWAEGLFQGAWQM